MTEALTLSPEVIAAIAAAVAAAKPAKKGKEKPSGRKPLTDEQKQTNRDKTDKATLANFKAKGYEDIQPRVNVMTYNKWIENGRRVKKGEKATVCGSFALFHVTQTESIVTTH